MIKITFLGDLFLIQKKLLIQTVSQHKSIFIYKQKFIRFFFSIENVEKFYENQKELLIFFFKKYKNE